MEGPGGPRKRKSSSQKGSKSRQKRASEVASAQNRKTKVQSTNKSHQEWNNEVGKFRISLQDAEASDNAVQSAWARLRQSYRTSFNAVAYPHGRIEDLEPFPFWAAENIEEDILERVIRIEFSSSLATYLLSRLQSIASMSDLSMFTLILYFGSSLFEGKRALELRKRVHIFRRSMSNTWPFTDAYKRMLCEAAALTNKAPVDTTDIPSRGMPAIFTERILSILAPANPEFERGAGKKEKTSVESHKTSLSGIPMSKKFLLTSSQSSEASAVQAGMVKDARGAQQTVVQDSNNFARKETAGQIVAESQENDPRVSPSPTGLSQKHRSTPDCNSVLPSIEFDEFASKASSSPYGSKLSSTPGFSKLKSPMSQTTAHSSDGRFESSSTKRPVKEEPDFMSENNPSKRINAANSKADLLLQAKIWDDETIIFIMKQLAGVRPNEFLLVNCLEVNPEQVFLQKGGSQPTLLVPFKLQNSQRLLAVVSLIPVYDMNQAGKQGYIQYLNPGCSREDENRELSRIAVEFLHLLGKKLPGFSSSPEKWHFQQNYTCPHHFKEEDGGPALCLATMSFISGPLKAPLAMQTDWMFWRHIILGCSFPEDRSVQVRTKNYLRETVETQIRQSKSMVVNSGGCERFDDEIMNHQDRILQRHIRAQSLLHTAQEAGDILQNLTNYIYKARIAVKHDLDTAKLHREEHHSESFTKGECLSGNVFDGNPQHEWQRAHDAHLEEIETSIRFLKARAEKVHDLHHCLKQAGLLSRITVETLLMLLNVGHERPKSFTNI